MAHDVAEYLCFVGRARVPDLKVVLMMLTIFNMIFLPINFMFTRQHYINTMCNRFEVYAVKNGGYKKFREKMFRTHKIPVNLGGQYS